MRLTLWPILKSRPPEMWIFRTSSPELATLALCQQKPQGGGVSQVLQAAVIQTMSPLLRLIHSVDSLHHIFTSNSK